MINFSGLFLLIAPLAWGSSEKCLNILEGLLIQASIPQALGDDYRAYSQNAISEMTPLSGRFINPAEEELRRANFVIFARLRRGIYIVTSDDYDVEAAFKPRDWGLPKSNYQAEILAYELSQKLGFDLVPPTIERPLTVTIDGQTAARRGSLQMFVEGDRYVERIHSKNAGFRHNVGKQGFFDFIIQNADRDFDNYFIGDDGSIFSIDNGMSFTGHGGFFTTEKKEVEAIYDFLLSVEGGQIIERFR